MNVSAEYWAGFFDGDGTVTTADHHKPRVSVTNTDLAILEALRRQWGGYICPRKTYNPRAKPAWFWCLDSRKAVPFLLAILPYVRIKRERVQLALDYINIGWLKGTPEQRESIRSEREAISQHLKRLNQKGV